MPKTNFLHPAGESALADPDSVSWRIFRNPLALYIGGITAVLLELAEPRVRSGVWEHTTFRTEPLKRMQRTGLAAMVTVYAARSVSEKMIANVGKMHGRIQGTTPDGIPYRADDPELLCWVHATALFGFMEAYHKYVTPLSNDERDCFIAEGIPAAKLYGAKEPPSSMSDMRDLFDKMEPQLEPSDIINEFLAIITTLSIFPRPLRFVNRWMIKAAIDLVPQQIQTRIGLPSDAPSSPQAAILRSSGSMINRLHLKSSPASQACLRLGLPANKLMPPKR